MCLAMVLVCGGCCGVVVVIGVVVGVVGVGVAAVAATAQVFGVGGRGSTTAHLGDLVGVGGGLGLVVGVDGSGVVISSGDGGDSAFAHFVGVHELSSCRYVGGSAASAHFVGVYELSSCRYADGIVYVLSSCRYDGGIAASAHFVGVYGTGSCAVVVAVGGSSVVVGAGGFVVVVGFVFFVVVVGGLLVVVVGGFLFCCVVGVGMYDGAASALLHNILSSSLLFAFALKNCRISVWRSSVMKNFAVDCFAALFASFLFLFSAALLALLASAARSCSVFLSADVPVRNTFSASFSCCRSSLVIAVCCRIGFSCALYVKQLSGVAAFPAFFISFLTFLTSAVDSTHVFAFASLCILRTLSLHPSLSRASSTSASQLSDGSTSISISPSCRCPCMCLMACFTSRSSCSLKIWPSHLSRLALIHSSRLNVHVSAVDSCLLGFPVICDSIYAFAPFSARLACSSSSHASAP